MRRRRPLSALAKFEPGLRDNKLWQEVGKRFKKGVNHINKQHKAGRKLTAKQMNFVRFVDKHDQMRTNTIATIKQLQKAGKSLSANQQQFLDSQNALQQAIKK